MNERTGERAHLLRNLVLVQENYGFLPWPKLVRRAREFGRSAGDRASQYEALRSLNLEQAFCEATPEPGLDRADLELLSGIMAERSQRGLTNDEYHLRCKVDDLLAGKRPR